MKKEKSFVDFKLPLSLTEEELNTYFGNYKLGDLKARDVIITRNMRLVGYVVSKFSNTGYDLSELFSVGLLGLIKSVDTFDVSKGIKFATYATRCINNEILMFLRKEKKHLNDIGLEEPLNVDYEGNELKLEDVLEDKKADFVLDYLDNELYLKIRELVEQMPERDRLIIKLYFGFDGEVFTQQEIAARLGITQSYLSRIISKLIKKIGKQLERLELIKISDWTRYVGIEKNLKATGEVTAGKARLKGIYQYFKDYTKEQIDEMLSKLCEDEKELIVLRYGDDLEHPVKSLEWSIEHARQFYNKLVPKMKKMLAKPNVQYRNSLIKNEANLVPELKDTNLAVAAYDIDHGKTQEVKTFSALGQENVLLESDEFNLDNDQLFKLISAESDNLSVGAAIEEDYLWVLELLKQEDFSQIMTMLSAKETVIILLKFGYVNGRYFSTKAISEFLGISTEEIREVTTKFLLACKEDINKSIDKTIAYVTDRLILEKKKTKPIL